MLLLLLWSNATTIAGAMMRLGVDTDSERTTDEAAAPRKFSREARLDGDNRWTTDV